MKKTPEKHKRREPFRDRSETMFFFNSSSFASPYILLKIAEKKEEYDKENLKYFFELKY